MSARPRVLVALPDHAEVVRVSEWLLLEELIFVPVRSGLAAVRELQANRFDVMIADAAITRDAQVQTAARANNPRLQVIVVGDSPMPVCGEAFHLARPVDEAMLLCHVTMAVVEARPVRRSPRKALARFDAIVEGMPAYLVDVSKDGLRLELPRGRTAALPPEFTVQVPLVGVAVTVRRVWMSSVPGAEGAAWCGATLHQPTSRTEHYWHAFVDTVPAR
jgi:hypothetical protein